MLTYKTTTINISFKKAIQSCISAIIIVTCLFSIVCFNLNSLEKQIDSQQDKTQLQKDKEKQELITNFALVAI